MTIEERLDELVLQLKIQNQLLARISMNYLIVSNAISDEDFMRIARESLDLLSGNVDCDDEELLARSKEW